jgi:hypothetical protein
LQNQMAAASGQLHSDQAPELFLPDARPARLSEDAKKAIRKLAAFIRQDKPAIFEIEAQYETAAAAAGKEIEPKLIYGLLLMKTKQIKQRDDAIKQFEELQSEHPQLTLPKQAIAWLRFERQTCDGGVSELAELVSLLPKPKSPADAPTEDAKQIYTWCGQLRDYAAEAPVENRRASAKSLAALDAAIAAQGAEAKNCYEQGRAKTRKILDDFYKKIAAADEEAERARLKIERRQLSHYAEFPFDRAMRDILAGIDRQEKE